MTDITMHSNVVMAADEKLELEDASNPNHYVNTFTQCDYNAYLTGAGDQWWLGRYGSSSNEYTSFTGWQAASRRAELPNGSPDAHGHAFTSIATHFPSYTSGTVTAYALASGSSLLGTGQGGSNPGYAAADCGPGW